MFEKIVLITRKTRVEELTERFNTAGQARFYIERATGDFGAYLAEHDAYRRSLDLVRRAVETGLRVQVMDRALAPTFLFDAGDLIVTLGQDGLVANTAKYVGGQPIIAVNPDPDRFDGILLPFTSETFPAALDRVLAGKARMCPVTMAEARLADGQRLLAFNDLFIGASSHVSARYRIATDSGGENQSSSGVIVSTGAGSSGWMSSIFNQTRGVAEYLGVPVSPPDRLAWDDSSLLYAVREPFLSRHSAASIIAGSIAPGGVLTLESQMPSGGVIFSDGVEADRLQFNSGAVATIRAAGERANLVIA